jgi:hypothetical protein
MAYVKELKGVKVRIKRLVGMKGMVISRILEYGETLFWVGIYI